MKRVQYVISGNLLGRLKDTGCTCSSLGPNDVCGHCDLIGRIKTEHKVSEDAICPLCNHNPRPKEKKSA
jgi:hypothetical protein